VKIVVIYFLRLML